MKGDEQAGAPGGFAEWCLSQHSANLNADARVSMTNSHQNACFIENTRSTCACTRLSTTSHLHFASHSVTMHCQMTRFPSLKTSAISSQSQNMNESPRKSSEDYFLDR